jgi:hypothetical protein
MTDPGWDDDRLLDELRTAVRQAGSPTPAMKAAGYAAFAWWTIDAELAALTDEVVGDEVATVRGPSAPPRTLLFTGTQVSVELERSATSLIGQLVPPASGEVTLLGPDGELAVADADEVGGFHFQSPPTGLVRLRCRTSSGVLLTDWFRL